MALSPTSHRQFASLLGLVSLLFLNAKTSAQSVALEKAAQPTLHCASDEMMQSRPDLLLKQQQLDDMLLAKKAGSILEKAAELPYVLPVVVHIIHGNGAENIPDAQALNAIEHLNQAFAHEGYYATQGDGTNTQIQFCLARRDPYGNATTGITRTVSSLTNMTLENDDIALKDLNRWDPTQYVNVWVVNSINSLSSGPGVIGYAFLASAHGEPMDGLVCEAPYFGLDPAKDAVFIHELGHYLDLYHTFTEGCPNDDCQTAGDKVCDTPPDQSTHTNCVFNSCDTDTADPSANNPFSTNVNDMTENFMDYSPFQCYRSFTAGQGERMRLAIEQFRNSLLESEGCKAPCTALITASFLPPATDVLTGETVVFTNQTSGATNFEWYVNGNLAATTMDLSYQFTGTGNFQVTLKAFNADPNCTEKAEAIISVACSVAASFTANATELELGEALVCTNTSTGATGYEWRINGVNVGTAADLTYAFSNPGSYFVILQATNNYCSIETSFSVTVSQDGPCEESERWTWKISTDQNTNYINYEDNTLDGGYFFNGYLVPNGMISKHNADGDTVWQRKFSIPANGIIDVRATPDGGCVATMAANGSLTDRICKLDADGNLQWSKKVDIQGATSATKVAIFGDQIVFMSERKYPSRAILVAFNLDGSVAWNKVYETDPGLEIFDLKQSLDEQSLWLVGTFLFPRGAAVLKIDKEGNILLMKHLGVTGSNDAVELHSFDLTPDGGLVATGRTSDANSDVDFLMMKLDAEAQIEWVNKIGMYTGVVEYGLAAVAMPDGSSLVGYIAQGEVAAIVGFTATGELAFANQIIFQGNSFPSLKDIEWNQGKLQAWIKIYQDQISLIELDETGYPHSICATIVPLQLTAEQYPLTEQPATWSLLPQGQTVTDFATILLPTAPTLLTKSPSCYVQIICPEDCANSLDDDEDGYVDCFDSDCQCFDGEDCSIDNNSDLAISAKIAWNTTTNTINSQSSPAVADMDGDGRPEIIIAAKPITNFIIEYLFYEYHFLQGDGSDAANPVKLSIPLGVDRFYTMPAIGDVNGDGKPELVVITKLQNGAPPYIKVFTNYNPNSNPPMTLMATSDSSVIRTSSLLFLADLDSDGISEIINDNDVFKFDFTNPNAPLLLRTLNGIGHNGGAGSNTQPTAADLLSPADCGGDIDCEGLEIAAGAYIYSIDLDPFDGDGVQMKVKRNLNQMSGMNFADGYTYTADINLDGILDVVTSGKKGTQNGIYAWDKNGLIKFFAYPATVNNQQFLAIAIANTYDDTVTGFSSDFPEIITCTDSKLISYNLHAATANPSQSYWWATDIQDISGVSAPSCFDFNGDGFAEILIRDEISFRLLYGGASPFPMGVDANRNWYTQGAFAGTLDEFPVVADVDVDGEAEILFATQYVPCCPGGSVKGDLYVLESDGNPWASARPIWNQFNYFGANINDDLTVPKHPQAHHLEFPGLGSGKRPFNSAQTQWSTWGPDFSSLFPVPDAALTVDSTACEGDSLRLWLSLCNLGSSPLPDGLPIAFYQNDPRQAGAVFKGTSLSQPAVPVDSCASFSVKIAAVFNAPIFVVANDDGSHPLPFSMSDFPITAQTECDFENNFDGFVFNHLSSSLNLGPDLSLCSSSVTALNAGAGFNSYHWQDGTTDSIFTAFGPGTYWVDAKDGCGNLQSDTVLILLNQTATIELGDDLTICEGESLQLDAPGFANVQWSPADGLSCTNCPMPTATPGADVTYYVTAANGNCFASDSIHVFLAQKPVLTLVAQDDCLHGPQISVSATGTAPLGFIWSNGATGSTISPSASGSYTVTVTTSLGCETTATASVTVVDSLAVELQTSPITCSNGIGTATATASGGTAPFAYLWSNGGDVPTVSVTNPGPISVTVTDANGCISSTSATIGVVVQLQSDISITPISCQDGQGGAATVQPINGTAPFVYIWSNGGDAPTVSVTNPGPISVTVTDANGCISSTSATIELEGQLQLGISITPISCQDGQGGAATVQPINGTAPFAYIWSNGGDAPTVSVTNPGPISVTVTDANGCISSTSTTVGIMGQLQLGISITPISCHDSQDGAATVQPINGTAPFSWLWANGATGSQLTGLAGGTYSVTVTDANGCSDNLSFAMNAPPALSLNLLGTDISCFGEMDGTATVVAVGGAPGYQYLWSDLQTTATASQLGQGLQTVTVTDENGCTDSASVFVSEPPLLNAAVLAGSPIVCPDSTTNIAAIPMGGTPPYSFSWPSGQTDSLLAQIGAGDYTVTVSDENGCTANATITIQSQPLAMLVQDSVVAASSPTATDGSVFVEFSGGQPPFTFLWSNGDTSQNLLSVAAGDYALSLSDALGCEQTFPFAVAFSNAASQKWGKAWEASILPNPAAEGGKAQLGIQSSWTQIIDYKLFGLTGKLLYEERVQVSAGYKLHPVTTPSAAGVYLVVLSNERDIVCLKWVVVD